MNKNIKISQRDIHYKIYFLAHKEFIISNNLDKNIKRRLHETEPIINFIQDVHFRSVGIVDFSEPSYLIFRCLLEPVISKMFTFKKPIRLEIVQGVHFYQIQATKSIRLLT